MPITHQVQNQDSSLTNYNLFSSNQALVDTLHSFAPGLSNARLHALGDKLGSYEMQEHARLANLHKPVLHSHDRFGQRIDTVEFHPSYHVLLGQAITAGLHGAVYASDHIDGGHAHLARAAGFMMFTELEAAVLCPVSMSYAVWPALQGNQALCEALLSQLTSNQYDARACFIGAKRGATMGMGMTEKQGGSDVRSNSTQALFEVNDAWGARYRITGHKWFFSAPMSDAFLVLAQTPEGLSCFFMPRFLPTWLVDEQKFSDSIEVVTTNAIQIQRLKDKLGNHANASSEVEFEQAYGWLIGEPGRGIAQILAMGNMTRLDCALGTAGLMRQALSLALDHCRQRMAFGKPLIAQPLMQNVLADLALESEAATVLALRLAHAIDQSQDPTQQAIARLLTPIAKFWICKRGSLFAQEAMECLGGNGYVEAQGQGVMARIYREMPLNSIWEGAGNIMALDLLRALKSESSLQALRAELQPAAGANVELDRKIEVVLLRIEQFVEPSEARALAQDLALCWQAALLYQCSPDFVFQAFCQSRMAGDWGQCFGTLPKQSNFAALLARAMPR